MQSKSSSRLRGFTLVELLVVILIMTILLSIGAGILRGASGKGVSTSLASTEALFEEARAIAVGKGTKARVLIDGVDPTNDDTYLRRILVAFEQLDDDGEPKGEWEVASRGYILPEKTFYSQELSMKDHKSGSRIDKDSFSFTKSGFDGEYYAYEFNSEGICTTPGASFVIGAGARGVGDAQPRTTGEGERDFAGFVIWRNGSTSLFRNTEQILQGTEPKNF